jgi:hypothetical protein
MAKGTPRGPEQAQGRSTEQAVTLGSAPGIAPGKVTRTGRLGAARRRRGPRG